MSITNTVGSYTNLPTVLIGLTVGLLTYYVYNRFRYRLPPGPWYIPLIGNYNIYTQKSMHRIIAKLTEQYGPVVSIAAGPVKCVFLNRLDVVVEALVKKKADFASRPVTHSINIFTDGGKDIAFAPYNEMWKFEKKIAGKALRYYMQGSILEDMLNDVCVQIFEKMSKETKPFTPKDYIDTLIIHMLFNMCFGTKCNLDDPDDEFMLKADNKILEQFGSGFFEDIIPFMIKVYKTKRFREFETDTSKMLAFIRRELEEHQNSFDPNNIRDYVDSILFARQEAEAEGKDREANMLTDSHDVQIAANIFFGGLVTTRMTLDWFISFMLKYPEFQKKCQEEIDNVIGTNRSPRAKDRPDLCFTETCIMESMRMGTVSALGVPHATLCDTSVGGYDIPKGTMVVINHWALHNDPTFWKDVHKFDPYRYLDSKGQMDKKPESWLPFSAGRRVCLGEPVARAEFVLIVSNLLQNFTFKVPPGVTHKCEAMFPFAGGELPVPYQVVIEKRK